MPVRFRDAYPCLGDKIKKTPIDQHYIYHPAWAARILSQTKPEEHIDISSILSFGTILSAFVPEPEAKIGVLIIGANVVYCPVVQMTLIKCSIILILVRTF